MSLWHFAVSVVPGFLQTPAYAREVLARVASRSRSCPNESKARTGRREVLEDPSALPFRAILAEAVLRTPLRDAGE